MGREERRDHPRSYHSPDLLLPVRKEACQTAQALPGLQAQD